MLSSGNSSTARPMAPYRSITLHGRMSHNFFPMLSFANSAADVLRRLGAGAVSAVGRLGYATRFWIAVVANTPAAFARLHLPLREIYFSAVLSLIVILR